MPKSRPARVIHGSAPYRPDSEASEPATDLSWSETLHQARQTVLAGQSPSEDTWKSWIEAARAVPHDQITAVSQVVYYLRFGDRIKIGYTTSLATRLSAVPHDELLAVEKGGREVERLRHQQFAAARVRGEWFNATPELLEHCASLARNTL